MKKIIIFVIFWILSIGVTSAYGELYWAKTYGGSESDFAYSVQKTNDTGFIVAGQTYTFGAGSSDYWILKLDTNGVVEWQKTYGGSSADYAGFIQQTNDGGYVVAGENWSYFDCWVLKLDSSGTVEWQKVYGGSEQDRADCIKQTTDGGYIVCGFTSSYGAGNADYWVLKLDSSGNIEWQKAYGRSDSDYAKSIQQTSDGGYIVAGFIDSYGAGSPDYWVLKLDSSGNIEWQKTYGGSEHDYAKSIQQTTDNGYIVAGESWSYGAGQSDCWVLKLSSSGNVEWQKSYGGDSWDWVNCMELTVDGGCIIAGYTSSYGAGSNDSWALKLDSNGDVEWQKTYGGSSDDKTESIMQIASGGYIMAGYTYSYGAGNADYWILKLDRNGNISDCDSINTGSITVSDPTASGVNTNLSVYTSSATITDTSVIPQNSSAGVAVICEWDDGSSFPPPKPKGMRIK